MMGGAHPAPGVDWGVFLAAAEKGPPDTWAFDTRTQRWRWPNTGRAVPPRRINALLDRRLATAQNAMRLLGGQAARGEITRDEFVTKMRIEIKTVHLQARMLAVGGKAGMTPRDYGRAGAAIKREYSFLANFARELPDLSEAAASDRAGKYAGSSVRDAYFQGARDSHERAGYDQKRRSSMGDDRVCETCSREAEQGWVDIDTPGWTIGDTDCGSRDRCVIDFRRSGRYVGVGDEDAGGE